MKIYYKLKKRGNTPVFITLISACFISYLKQQVFNAQARECPPASHWIIITVLFTFIFYIPDNRNCFAASSPPKFQALKNWCIHFGLTSHCTQVAVSGQKKCEKQGQCDLQQIAAKRRTSCDLHFPRWPHPRREGRLVVKL